MGCNAFNHPLDCNCGWGGVHYEPSNPEYGPDYWKNESSHTNPNARCPVCGDRVFFYRSPDGGAVYFDGLGPPWPKHPCTDQGGAHPSKVDVAEKKEGWWPYLMETCWPSPVKEGSILYDTQDRLLVTKSRSGWLRYDTPIWIQAVPGALGVYRLSTLRTKNGKTHEVVTEAYSKVALEQIEFASKFQGTVALLNKPA